MIRLLLCLALLSFATPAFAAETGLRTLVTRDDGRGWEAVGRIDIGGGSFCTGTLIAADLVLTAAHCLFEPETGRRHDASEIRFLAGWRGGNASAYRDIRRAVVHPDFDFGGKKQITRVAHDLALLELSQPIRSTSVTPFATRTQPRKGAEVGVVSYAHNRAESPALQEVCHVLARRGGTLVLSCSVDFGSSGAPIFEMVAGRPEIVSVVSAKAAAGGQPVALGTALQGPLSDLRAALASGDGVFHRAESPVRRLTIGASRDATGAKFLRP